MAENKNKSTSKPIVEETLEINKDEVIAIPESTRDVPTLGFNEDGVMGSTTTKTSKTKIEKEPVIQEIESSKVALFSIRNMYAEGAGKLNVGYNIVPKKYSDFWLAQRGVRLATPEEVAEAFA